MKRWSCILAAVGMLAGCQAQSKPPAAGTAPSVLDVSAARTPRQPSVYAVPSAAHASYAAPAAASAPARVPAYLPPEGSDTSAPPTDSISEAAPQADYAPSIPASAKTVKHVKGDGKTYIVKAGDTLFRIAKEHYGSGAKWHQIADANPGLTPANLKAGQKLLMP